MDYTGEGISVGEDLEMTAVSLRQNYGMLIHKLHISDLNNGGGSCHMKQIVLERTRRIRMSCNIV